jgi:hypothetical protein
VRNEDQVLQQTPRIDRLTLLTTNAMMLRTATMLVSAPVSIATVRYELISLQDITVCTYIERYGQGSRRWQRSRFGACSAEECVSPSAKHLDGDTYEVKDEGNSDNHVGQGSGTQPHDDGRLELKEQRNVHEDSTCEWRQSGKGAR